MSFMALLTPSNAGGQDVGLGVRAGVIRSEVNSSGDESQNVALEHRSSPTGGLFLSVPLSGGFSVEPEALLSARGTQWSTPALEGSLHLTYLDFPVLLRYAGPAGRPVRIHVLGGPSVAFLLHAISKLARPAPTEVDVKDRYNSVDLGWVVGIGVGGGRFQLDLRYGGSFGGITTKPQLGGCAPPPAAGATPTFRNRAFQLLAGVRFF
jgi:hypothetical protein